MSVTSDMPGTYRSTPLYPPGVLVAATPAWFADNITQISLVVLIITTVLVVRLVHTTATRTILLLLVAAVAVLVYVNRDALKACARTCECQVADQDLSVPFCDPDVLAAPSRFAARR